MEPDVDGATSPGNQEVNNGQTESARWRALFNFTSQSHFVVLACAITTSILSGIVIPTLAIFLGKIFDIFTTFGAGAINRSELVIKVSKYALYLAGLGSASGLLNAMFFGLWLLFGELQAMSVRRELFNSMLARDLEWYDLREDDVETLISRQQR